MVALKSKAAEHEQAGIYAIIGVLTALLLWRVATQWKNRSQEA